MTRTPKQKGDIAEVAVTLALLEAGYGVYVPQGDNLRSDLIAEDRLGGLFRVQVKNGRLRHGAVQFEVCSKYHHRGGTSRSYRGQVDVLAVWCPETRMAYVLNIDDCGERSGTLRVEPSGNGQVAGIRWARDYELKATTDLSQLPSPSGHVA